MSKCVRFCPESRGHIHIGHYFIMGCTASQSEEIICLSAQNNSFLSNCPLSNLATWASLQVDEGWWIGEAHGRFGLFPANYVEVPCPFPSTQTDLSHTIYTVHHDHFDRCGNDVNEEDAEVEVGVERRNEAELANIKTLCPVDLYLLCIISFPKQVLGKWTI